MTDLSKPIAVTVPRTQVKRAPVATQNHNTPGKRKHALPELRLVAYAPAQYQPLAARYMAKKRWKLIDLVSHDIDLPLPDWQASLNAPFKATPLAALFLIVPAKYWPAILRTVAWIIEINIHSDLTSDIPCPSREYNRLQKLHHKATVELVWPE